MRKNLFFVQSDFHYIICKNIIASDHLNPNDCYFICGRGLKIDRDYNQFYYYDGDKRHFFPRLKFYVQNRSKVNSFFEGYDIYFYSPFMNYYNRYNYYKDYIFYEEGLAAFSLQRNRNSIRGPLIDFFEKVLISLIFFTANKNIKGYLKGFDFSKFSPHPGTTIITCSEGAYKYRNHQYLTKKLYKLNNSLFPSFTETIPAHSYFVVLDRFTTFGIVYELDNYKKCVRKMFDYLIKQGVSEVWTKFHPADFKNSKGKTTFEETVKDFGIKVHYFNGRLEYLAYQDINIHFMGTNSTILFYAPILGKSNKSISFVRYFCKIDNSYKTFIDSFGGIDNFISFFSKTVECVD